MSRLFWRKYMKLLLAFQCRPFRLAVFALLVICTAQIKSQISSMKKDEVRTKALFLSALRADHEPCAEGKTGRILLLNDNPAIRDLADTKFGNWNISLVTSKDVEDRRSSGITYFQFENIQIRRSTATLRLTLVSAFGAESERRGRDYRCKIREEIWVCDLVGVSLRSS